MSGFPAGRLITAGEPRQTLVRALQVCYYLAVAGNPFSGKGDGHDNHYTEAQDQRAP